jgi:subfamily B ATP-binding cassette protein MsbA
MFYQNWKLALFAILMMPLAGGLAKSLGKRIGKATSKLVNHLEILATFLLKFLKDQK